jgi:hypothetical protein
MSPTKKIMIVAMAILVSVFITAIYSYQAGKSDGRIIQLILPGNVVPVDTTGISTKLIAEKKYWFGFDGKLDSMQVFFFKSEEKE